MSSFDDYKEIARRRAQQQQAAAQNRVFAIPVDEPSDDVVMIDAPGYTDIPTLSAAPVPAAGPAVESDEELARRLQAEEYSSAESTGPREPPFRVLRPGMSSSMFPTGDIPDDFVVNRFTRGTDDPRAILRSLFSESASSSSSSSGLGRSPSSTFSSRTLPTGGVSSRTTLPTGGVSSRTRRAERRAEIERLMLAMLEGDSGPSGFGLPMVTPFGLMMGGGFGRDALFEHFLGSTGPDIDNMSYEELLELEERLGAVKPKGADTSEISRLPTETFKPTEEVKIDLTGDLPKESSSSDHKEQCSICMEEFESGDKLRRLPCFHAFHQACADKWLGINKVCPICRIPIDKAPSSS